MRVLDVFAGTGSATEAFRRVGHDVRTLDIVAIKGHEPTYLMDAKQLAKDPSRVLGRWKPDVVWLSPPCTAYSMSGKSNIGAGSASARWHFHSPEQLPFYGPRSPKDEVARLGVACVIAGLTIVRKLQPRWWWMENPQGGLQTMGFMLQPELSRLSGYHFLRRETITYCAYGESYMKPTTLWGVWPRSWVPKPRCYNGDPCHERSPRGAKTGLQALKGPDRGRIPRRLGESILAACDEELISFG